jgi:hypothetical protein
MRPSIRLLLLVSTLGYIRAWRIGRQLLRLAGLEVRLIQSIRILARSCRLRALDEVYCGVVQVVERLIRRRGRRI